MFTFLEISLSDLGVKFKVASQNLLLTALSFFIIWNSLCKMGVTSFSKFW